MVFFWRCAVTRWCTLTQNSLLHFFVRQCTAIPVVQVARVLVLARRAVDRGHKLANEIRNGHACGYKVDCCWINRFVETSNVRNGDLWILLRPLPLDDPWG